MYEPNFNDPRVIKRCKRALGFVFGVLKTHKEKECHGRSMERFFGQCQHPLSQYLKSQLLTLHDPTYYFSKGEGYQCKTYKLNREGAIKLYSDISNNLSLTKKREYQLIIEAWEQEHLIELQTGNFVYNDKSNRHWHPLQNIKSEPRKQLFSKYGYNHIYDIKACAPTLIAHLADAYSPKKTITVKRMNNTFDSFLNNTHQFRQHIANVAGIDYKTAKQIINSLFAGASLGANYRYDLFKLLDCDHDKMHALTTDSKLSALRSAISKAWSIIKIGEHLKVSKGKRLNSRIKWGVYFSYERLIMNVITEYMDKQYCQYFIEHDGWSCNVKLDLAELTQVVRTRTGIHNLEIDYDCG